MARGVGRAWPRWNACAARAGRTTALVLAGAVAKGAFEAGVIQELAARSAQSRLLNYVVAHELVHLLRADHAREFWATLGRVMPDCEARREKLRVMGRTMMVWQSRRQLPLVLDILPRGKVARRRVRGCVVDAHQPLRVSYEPDDCPHSATA